MSFPITGEVAALDSRIKYRPATKEDCHFMADGLRPDDLVELQHFAGEDRSAFEGLDYARRYSQDPQVVVFDGLPIALMGCENRGIYGCPWMAGTTILNDIPLLMFREARHLLEEWLHTHGQLANSVWVGSKSIPWLERLGFSMSAPAPLHTATGEDAMYQVFFKLSCASLQP